MTKQEELQYLIGIVTEASKWTPSPDDQRDLVRMEVEERINNLVMGVEPEPDENGLIQSTIHPDNPVDEPLTGADYQALKSAKLNDYIADKRRTANGERERWKADKTRVMVDGKLTWKPLNQCRKVPRYPDKPNCNLFKWIWVGENSATVEENLPTKDEQVESMWAEHDKSQI